MTDINNIKSKKELLDFVFLVDLVFTRDENLRQEQIKKAMEKARAFDCLNEFREKLCEIREFKQQEDEEKTSPLAEKNAQLDLDRNGNVKKTIDNYLIILKSDEKFSSLCFNELTGKGEFEGKGLTDSVKSDFIHYIEKKYGLKSERDFCHALAIFLTEHKYHPVRQAITKLIWDKKPRIEMFLQKIMGAEHSEYTKECSRLIFHCGIARIFSPGCKVDDVIILQGEQGNGKSTLVSWLCMNEDWYGRVNDIKGNVGIEQIQGKWICEISELLAISGRDRQEEAKQYLDRKSDNYRRPYAQFSEEIPRQCIFVGTTNLRQPFSDKTGNRRYYPVWCSIKPGELYDHEKSVKHYIAQCWAEAYHLWQKGEIRHAVKKEVFYIAQQNQKAALEDDWRVGIIESFLEDKTETCIIQLWTEALKMTDKPTARQSREIGAILDSLDGWEKGEGRKCFNSFRQQRFWSRSVTAELVRINDEYDEIVDNYT